jgi:hypothetical protein
MQQSGSREHHTLVEKGHRNSAVAPSVGRRGDRVAGGQRWARRGGADVAAMRQVTTGRVGETAWAPVQARASAYSRYRLNPPDQQRLGDGAGVMTFCFLLSATR